jgi:serine/threonine protein kinase
MTAYCSDLFGIGVLGYIALSSWSPWNSSDPKQLMQETMTLPVKFYASHWEGVSEEGQLDFQVYVLSFDVAEFAVRSAAKDFISMLVEKNPEKRPLAKDALKHPWLNSVAEEDKKEPAPVPQNLVRTKTAKAQTLYEGCELAKALTHHAQESELAPEIAAQA